jgi:hypothetical protein
VNVAVRPVSDSLHVSVLYGIEVDFRDMAQEIIVITNRVLPISTLPDALLLFEDLLRDRG